MDDTIQMVKLFENSGLLIDGATKTVKHEIKEQEARFHNAIMAPMAASLITPMISSLM